MKTLSKILQLYRQPHLLCLLLLGIASGIPFILVSSTLSIWLVQTGYSNTAIGWMFLSTLPYGLKFLWAPLIDQYSIPLLCEKFGQRRGWALFSQAFLILAILGLSLTDPAKNIYITAGCALLLSFCAATQDIVLDAYRIEKVHAYELPVGTALSGIGFRIGMLISGAGTLWLSSQYHWSIVYAIMATLILIGPIAVLLAKEPQKTPHSKTIENQTFPSFKKHFLNIKTSFVVFIERPQWMLLIGFIFFYKITDAMPNAMNGPLLLDLGYTTNEIAYMAKTLGTCMMIIGGFLGGILITQLGALRGIMVCGIAQLLSPLLFIFLVIAEHHSYNLMNTMAIQQICCGMGHTAFITYISSLCTKTLTATQFSLFLSISSSARILLSACGGIAADYLEWNTFFLCVTLSGIPFLYLLGRLARLQENTSELIRQPNT